MTEPDITQEEAREHLQNILGNLEEIQERAEKAQERHEEGNGYGAQALWAIPCYRGKLKGVDIEAIAQSCIEYSTDESNRRNRSQTASTYQDFLIPFNEDGPLDPAFTKIYEQVMDECNKFLDTPCLMHPEPWTIVSGEDQQIYPHAHNLGDYDWACVIWIQVPEGSSPLEFYPLGMQTGMDLTAVIVEPIAGDFLLFPGSLLHGVRNNKFDGDSSKLRISMSANITADPQAISNMIEASQEKRDQETTDIRVSVQPGQLFPPTHL